MKLTVTQLSFLSDQLGVKARPKKLLRVRSSSEKKDDAISDIFADYQRREEKVLLALTELELVPGTATLVAELENEVSQIQSRVRAAARDGAEKILKLAYKDLEAIKERAAKEVETGKKNPTFFVLSGAAEAALKKVESHVQSAHAQPKITEGRNALAAAISANDKKRYAESLTQLEAAKVAAATAKDLADKFNVYRIARAPAEAIIATMKGRYSDTTTWDGFNAELRQADQDATLAVRKYAEATSRVETIKSDMGATLASWTKNAIQKNIDEVGKLLESEFVAAESRQLADLLAAVPGKIAGEEWGAMGAMTARALRVQVIAVDKGTRRLKYLDAREEATDAIEELAPNTAMAPQVQEFNTLLGTADLLATSEAQRFEEAIALCDKIVIDCESLEAVAAAAKKFQDETKLLDKRLVTLQKLPAAAHMVDAVSSLQGLRSEAAKRGAPDVRDWNGGLEWLTRLRADLVAAEGLAARLTGPLAAQQAAKSVANAEDVTKAVELMRAEAAKLDAEPYKALVAAESKGIREACERALAALKEGKDDSLALAKQALAAAADLAMTGQNAKALQKNFDDALALTVQRQQGLVEVAKTGSYQAVEPRVSLIQAPLDQAKVALKTRLHAAGMAALGQANQVARAAEEAVDGIKAYDLRAVPLGIRCNTMKSAGDAVAAVEKLLADAKLAAAGLRFADARKLLDEADAKMEALHIKNLAKANPNDAGIEVAAAALLTLDGGEKMLDDFVKTLSGEASFELIAKLAEKRFGILLTSDAGKKTLSAQAIWAAMASVPASHATNSPSLKTVQRIKPDEGSSGAFGWQSKTATMNGRPDDGGTENFDEHTRQKALGLPLDHDVANDPYAPKNDEPADLFSMTVLHEVGHAVDDRLGFMAGKSGMAEFGGWVQYSDLGAIADAVATEKKYDRGYVMQLLNGGRPDAVSVPDGGDAAKWAKAKKAVDDWYALAKNGQIWYDYGKSKAASINGVVFQEAYANRWVSYLLAERAKGITAYQWRAPGEWFAEIYMTWFGDKLKDNHPFAPWLKTL